MGSWHGCPRVGGMGQLHRAARGDYSLETLVPPPVKQFSKHFPWNILTLKFKIPAVDMRGVEREEPKLAAGKLVPACDSSDASGALGHSVK